MHSTIVSELWDEFRRFIGSADREEAADIMITVLINNDEDIADIKSAFANDASVRKALAAYTDQDDDHNDFESMDDDIEDYDDQY